MLLPSVTIACNHLKGGNNGSNIIEGDWQSKGRGFESPQLHQEFKSLTLHPTSSQTHRLTSPNSRFHSGIETQLLTSLVDGFALTCKVEGKSPNTITFYKGMLDRVWSEIESW